MSSLFLPAFRSPFQSPVAGRHGGNTLPRTGLIFYAKAPGLTDSIGLSVSDYLSIDANLQPIFFINATTMRSATEILERIKFSEYLNISELVGKSQRGLALYTDGTAEAILTTACIRLSCTYGVNYGADFDGNTILDTPDIGAFEYQG